MQFLTTDDLRLNAIDAEDPEVGFMSYKCCVLFHTPVMTLMPFIQISDYNQLPEVARLADSVKSCLQESDDIPRDFTRLFDTKLYALDTSLVSPAIKLDIAISSCY